MFSLMIVDDEEIIRLEIKRLLDKNLLGFSLVDEATNGFDAIIKLVNNPVDLVITDIKMPKIDGIELLKEIKERNLASCVILISGYSDFKFAQQGIALGAFDYILKPVVSEKVCDVLKRAHKFLSDKKNEEEDKQKLVQKLTESLEIFFPEEKEKQLKAYINLGDVKAVLMAKELVNEVFEVYNYDYYKAGIIFSRFIANVIKEIIEKNPSIKKIYKIDSLAEIKFSAINNNEEFSNKFVYVIERILNLIVDYKLNEKDSIINKVCEYVVKNIDKNITLKSVSENFFISKNYLSFLFKQETGENFLEYLTRVKMERAKNLLGEGIYKAYEVGNMLGYSETAYFSKLFKKHTGLSPTEYRKNNLYTFND